MSSPSNDRVRAAFEAWEREFLEPAQAPPAETESGIPVKVLYTPQDLEGTDYLADVGFPGQYPFTRGVYPTMYRKQLWTMRQYAGYGTAEESSARFKYLMAHGQTGLSVAFDLPTQMGHDSDEPEVEDEVGRVGVAVDTLRDMEVLFEGIPLDRISTNFTTNATAAIIVAMYALVGERQGVSWKDLRGTVQNDILKEYTARNLYIFPPAPSLRLIADTIAFCSTELPRFNPISISGFHVREAGADAVQELAFTLLAATVYVREVLARGIPVDQFAPRLSFQLASSREFFEEVAKYRAARRMWARIMREEFGATDPNSWRFRVYSGGSGINLTAEEPLNNIIRTALQCLEVVLGGGQTINVMTFDEAYAIPTALSQRVSLRTQQIIAHESGVTKTVDPLAGSYYVESLTGELERRARAKMAEIEARGGYVRAIEQGEIQREVHQRAHAVQKKTERGEHVFVGVNALRGSETERDYQMELHQPDPSVLPRQRERLAAVKAARDGQAVAAALARLRRAAASDENAMPAIVEAVRVYATVGEITGVFREVFGEFREPSIL